MISDTGIQGAMPRSPPPSPPPMPREAGRRAGEAEQERETQRQRDRGRETESETDRGREAERQQTQAAIRPNTGSPSILEAARPTAGPHRRKRADPKTQRPPPAYPGPARAAGCPSPIVPHHCPCGPRAPAGGPARADSARAAGCQCGTGRRIPEVPIEDTHPDTNGWVRRRPAGGPARPSPCPRAFGPTARLGVGARGPGRQSPARPTARITGPALPRAGGRPALGTTTRPAAPPPARLLALDAQAAGWAASARRGGRRDPARPPRLGIWPVTGPLTWPTDPARLPASGPRARPQGGRRVARGPAAADSDEAGRPAVAGSGLEPERRVATRPRDARAAGTRTDSPARDGLRRTQTDSDGLGRTRTDSDGLRRTQTDSDGLRRTRTDSDVLGRTRTDSDGFGRTRTDSDG